MRKIFKALNTSIASLLCTMFFIASAAAAPFNGAASFNYVGANLPNGLARVIILGPVAINYASTTAVKIGTTPNNGENFCLVDLVMTNEAISGTLSLNSATWGVGVTSPNYNETLFAFLASSILAQGQYTDVPTSLVTSTDFWAPNTDVFFKMTVGVTGGTMTGHATMYGINCN